MISYIKQLAYKSFKDRRKHSDNKVTGYALSQRNFSKRYILEYFTSYFLKLFPI